MRNVASLVLLLCTHVYIILADYEVIPKKDSWKYLDTGAFTTSSSNGYQAVAYDDSSWATGSAPLGFGYSDIASVISFGSNASNKYPAAFFRKSFSLTDVDSTNAPLNITVNFVHGARCFLNGVEIYRKNLPTTGVVDGTTLATTAVTKSTQVYLFNVATTSARLQLGKNVVACDVHLVNIFSTATRFDFNLIVFGVEGPTMSASPSITPSISTSTSLTASRTASPSVSESASTTASTSLSRSASPTISLTPSTTPTISDTASVTASISVSPSVTSTVSLTATTSATISESPSTNVSSTSTASASVSPSFSSTFSMSTSMTATASISQSATISFSSSQSRSSSRTPSPSASCICSCDSLDAPCCTASQLDALSSQCSSNAVASVSSSLSTQSIGLIGGLGGAAVLLVAAIAVVLAYRRKKLRGIGVTPTSLASSSKDTGSKSSSKKTKAADSPKSSPKVPPKASTGKAAKAGAKASESVKAESLQSSKSNSGKKKSSSKLLDTDALEVVVPAAWSEAGDSVAPPRSPKRVSKGSKIAKKKSTGSSKSKAEAAQRPDDVTTL